MRAVLCVLVGVAAACGGSSKNQPPPPPIANKQPAPEAAPADPPSSALSERDQMMQRMSYFRVKMCACSDSACVQAVSDELTTWAMELAKRETPPPAISEQDQKTYQELGTQMGECMQRAMAAGSAPAPTP